MIPIRFRLFLGLAATAFVTNPIVSRAQEPSVRSEADTRDEKEDEAPQLPLTLAAFVDAYAAWQTGGKGTLATLSDHRAFTGQGSTGRAENGLSLAWLGLDAAYDAGTFGIVASFRFGQAASLFHGNADLRFGVQYLTQAYALYRPIEQLELDLGMFLSPFGYEALESWKNPNYTISALYTYAQPSWHMGLRASWQLDASWKLMGMLVNGVNNISETQQRSGLSQTPTLGGALTYQVNKALSLALGGMAALDQRHNADEGYDIFADVVSVLELEPLTVALNIDYIFTRDGAPNGSNRNFVGSSLTVAYWLSAMFSAAARGEYLRDDASFGDSDEWQLWTATLTLDVKPVQDKSYLIVRWENRWEHSNQRIFGKNSRGTEDTADDSYQRSWFESVLGVVLTTKP